MSTVCVYTAISSAACCDVFYAKVQIHSCDDSYSKLTQMYKHYINEKVYFAVVLQENSKTDSFLYCQFSMMKEVIINLNHVKTFCRLQNLPFQVLLLLTGEILLLNTV